MDKQQGEKLEGLEESLKGKIHPDSLRANWKMRGYNGIPGFWFEKNSFSSTTDWLLK